MSLRVLLDKAIDFAFVVNQSSTVYKALFLCCGMISLAFLYTNSALEAHAKNSSARQSIVSRLSDRRALILLTCHS